jgi:hypothetical protein
MQRTDCEYITRSKSPDPGRSTNIARFQEFSRLELPRLVRRTLEVAVEREAQPLEERLKDQLVDIVRECQSQLFSMFQGSGQPVPTEELAARGEPDSVPVLADSTPDPAHSFTESAAALPTPTGDLSANITTPDKQSPPAMDPTTDSPESYDSMGLPERSFGSQIFPEDEQALYTKLPLHDSLVQSQDSSGGFGYDDWPEEWGIQDFMTMYSSNAGMNQGGEAEWA